MVERIDSKAQPYLDHGTRRAWVIHPDHQTATIHRPDGSAQRLHDQQSLDGEDVRPGFTRRLADSLGSHRHIDRHRRAENFE